MVRAYRGRLPVVHPTAYVDESAQIVGDVAVGAESSIWLNVVARGDVNYIRIGARTNIQDGTVVHVQHDTHPAILGDEVTVGHAAIVHGCVIANRVLIGMGAIVLTGARIGEDVIVAAGALVTEGMVVPPRSLVMGLPGRVTRRLTDVDVAFIREHADNYVRYRQDYQIK